MHAPRPRSLRNASLFGLWSLLAALAAGCSSGAHDSSGRGPATPAAEPNGWGTSAEAQSEPGAPPPPAAAPADAGGATAPSPSPAEPSREARSEERPGLATHWGETRSSHVRTTTFDRASGSSPFATATLWYNDRQGARTMAASEGRGRRSFASLELAQGGVTVSLRGEDGSTLPAVSSGGRLVAVGDAGSRYTIQLVNHTPARFEAVVSVDGLDVLDGREATVSKRGYILAPHATVEIDGFRRSESAVAAFRFGSVSGSYAARKGDDRNVGVVGVALFHEAGTEPWPWDENEARRRRNANPFPGRFAEPPP
ncbi:MAG TPA: hypothetical protein VFS43_18960 [Polyangiaceae bacterium]|nr:hypothetical protein [Polyangiaceae bacterium]